MANRKEVEKKLIEEKEEILRILQTWDIRQLRKLLTK